jgi:copper resistance protein B
LLAALLLVLPLAAMAQSDPAASGSTASMAMDHAGVHDRASPATVVSAAKPAMKTPIKMAGKPHAPATPTPSSAGMHDTSGMARDSMSQMDHGVMTGTDRAEMHGTHHDSTTATPATIGHDMSAMDSRTVPDMSHGAAHDRGSMPGLTMGPMQGGRAPADARSGDYSDGIAASPMQGLHMHDSATTGMLLIDQLEAFHGRDGNGQGWEIQGWYGDDSDKLWLRSEGERGVGKFEDGNLEALWNHNVAPFWSTQLGVRHDFADGPARQWVAFGVEGLAPYWFEVEASVYAGPSGRTAARLRIDYELLFTQRLILQPEAEVNLYGRNDPQRRTGRGISDVQFGLRLRYQVRRQFAPYLGVNWVRQAGTSADYARQDHRPVLDRQWLAGIRVWF